MAKSNLSTEALYLAADPGKVEESEKLVPVEVWEDEPFERTEIQRVIEERKVPQVAFFFAFYLFFLLLVTHQLFVNFPSLILCHCHRFGLCILTKVMVSRSRRERSCSFWTRPTKTGGTSGRAVERLDTFLQIMSRKLNPSW